MQSITPVIPPIKSLSCGWRGRKCRHDLSWLFLPCFCACGRTPGLSCCWKRKRGTSGRCKQSAPGPCSAMMSSCETCRPPCETLSPLPAAGVCPQAPLSFGPSQGPRPRRTPEALTAPILSGMSRLCYAARPPVEAGSGRGGAKKWLCIFYPLPVEEDEEP
jgi:hypothetical protein